MKTKQISLFKDDNTVFEIKKHSSIVQMSNITTLQERKLMNVLLWIAKDFLKRNPNERIFNCDLWLLKRLTGLKKSDNSELKKALRHLSNIAIEYNILQKDDSNERGIFRFISEVKIKEEWVWKATTITFEFPTTVLETIKKPNMYVTLDLLIIRWLQSKYSIVLYEILSDYLKLQRLRCEIGDFKKLMWIQENQYNNQTMLKKRVLEVALNEINEKTDLDVGCEFEKIGRTTIALLFTMKPKQGSTKDDSLIKSVYEKLVFYGIKPEIINNLIQKHDTEYILANLDIVEEQIQKGEIKNVTAYLLKAFNIDFRTPETEYTKAQKEVEEKKQKEQEEKQRLEQEAEEQKAEEYRIKKEKAETYLSTLTEAKKEELLKEFLKEIKENVFLMNFYTKFGLNNPIIHSKRVDFLTLK